MLRALEILNTNEYRNTIESQIQNFSYYRITIGYR